jgi:hypothetical protein
MTLARMSSVARPGEVGRLISEIRAVTAKVKSLVAELRAERLKVPHPPATSPSLAPRKSAAPKSARGADSAAEPVNDVVPPTSL